MILGMEKEYINIKVEMYIMEIIIKMLKKDMGFINQ